VFDMVVAEFLAELQSAFPAIEMEEGHIDHWLGNSGAVNVYPTSEEEIAALLKYANENGKKVSVQGNGTKRGFGGLTEVFDILLDLSKYKGVVEHTVGDMIVTVKSGTPFQELQAYLAEHNQQVSIDSAWPEHATIGGIVASNESGPKRLGYGSARDAVVGLRVVYPDGTVIRTGGKVVKNVAGYDMNKLFIGSMGTIGVISEITLKLRPLPKSESLVLVSFQESMLEELRSFAVNQLDSMIEPVSFELLNPSLADKLAGIKQFTLAIGFEDVESAVIYQENRVKSAVPHQAAVHILRNEELRAFWNQLYRIGPNGIEERPDPSELRAVLKIGVKNMDVLQIMKERDALIDKYNMEVFAHGGLGHGICQLYLKGSEEHIASAIQNLRQKVEQLKGYVIVKHLPLSLRQSIPVWGEKPDYFFLLAGIKAKIDPHRVLNDKRFVGGI
jgi:glycolate oxidase FAD binding subunit